MDYNIKTEKKKKSPPVIKTGISIETVGDLFQSSLN